MAQIVGNVKSRVLCGALMFDNNYLIIIHTLLNWLKSQQLSTKRCIIYQQWSDGVFPHKHLETTTALSLYGSDYLILWGYRTFSPKKKHVSDFHKKQHTRSFVLGIHLCRKTDKIVGSSKKRAYSVIFHPPRSCLHP